MNKTITQFRWLVTMLLLVTAMAMPASTWAQNTISPSKPSGGGTENSPYQIGTAAELYWFAALVNGELGGETQNASANAVLTADINCSSITWTPIGFRYPYEGTFDGQGYTISGLYFNDRNVDFVGLFG